MDLHLAVLGVTDVEDVGYRTWALIGSASWPRGLRVALVLAVAVGVAELAHFILYACFAGRRRWRPTFFGELVHTAHFGTGAPVADPACSHHCPPSNWGWRVGVPTWSSIFIEIGYIAAFTWLTIGLLEIAHAFIVARLPEDIRDDVRGRRIRTQVYLLRQIMIWMLVFIGFAAILMTFPSIRNVGAGLFASAGVAGLVLGMAARPTLGNLIAGIQIALTEPIRIDDSVVVEGQ